MATADSSLRRSSKYWIRIMPNQRIQQNPRKARVADARRYATGSNHSAFQPPESPPHFAIVVLHRAIKSLEQNIESQECRSVKLRKSKRAFRILRMSFYPLVNWLLVTAVFCGCAEKKPSHLAICVDEKGYIHKIYTYYNDAGTNVILHGDYVQWKRFGIVNGRVFRGEREYRRYEDGRWVSGYSGGASDGWATFVGETWFPKDCGDIRISDLER